MHTLLLPEHHNAGVRLCTSRDELRQIHEPGVEVVLWLREHPPELVSYLNALDIASQKRSHFRVEPGQLREQLHQRLQPLSTQPEPYKQWLNDIQDLVNEYQQLVENPTPRVRLDFIHNNACQRFHRDNMTIRLITTYIGPGTEWLLADHLTVGSQRTDEYAQADIQHVPRFAVGLFKGMQHPNNQPTVFHRSPPIAGQNTHRFVLCLDDLAPNPKAHRTSSK
ncbi:MAG: DUF1826 domain-containing protein [Deltaproteobacteria bacterium]|nr:MAG: DUF1826 domain-containing protein [Deltaproteobacteria bacterium]